MSYVVGAIWKLRFGNNRRVKIAETRLFRLEIERLKDEWMFFKKFILFLTTTKKVQMSMSIRKLKMEGFRLFRLILQQ